jgi:crotonobetainyl-CoA:carnitine CoA-transferase CaiB-like acyl-CoA transferase
VAEAQLRGKPVAPQGNRHPLHAPQGMYPCAGEDQWLAVTIKSDEMWQGFGEATGLQDLAQKYPTVLARRRWQDEIDEAITAWTRQRTHLEAMARLQAVGIAAGAALTNKGLLEDPHLNERGFFVEIEHPAAGKHAFPSVPFRFSETALESWQPAPLLGEHNQGVLRDLLGLSDDEIAGLEAKQVIGSRPPAT